jgi:hypothetical protein
MLFFPEIVLTVYAGAINPVATRNWRNLRVPESDEIR